VAPVGGCNPLVNPPVGGVNMVGGSPPLDVALAVCVSAMG
jgi:hypothetical protein